MPFAFGDQRLRVTGVPDEYDDGDEVGRPVGVAAQFGKQLGIVAGVGFGVAGVACRMHPRRAAECANAQAGVVGECRQAAMLRGVAGLGQGVLDEGAVRLFGFGNAEIALRDDFEAERGKERIQLLHLLGVVGGENEFFHAASALSWAATSWRMPSVARSSSTFICSRVNGSPSAVPCTSTMPPAPVITTFMSVSQPESSG